jgi:prolyl 4-hydroxylase
MELMPAFHSSFAFLFQRPFAMKGRYYANVFVHFEPTGRPLNYENYDYAEDLDDFLPPYILPGSLEEENWKRRNPTGWHQASPSAAHIDTLPVFAAAAQNDIETLAKIAADNKRSLMAKDRNGWQPIHEAARGGHKEAIEFLVSNGADVNARTHKGTGVSPLHIALNAHDEEHPAAKYLIGKGAVNLGPEL